MRLFIIGLLAVSAALPGLCNGQCLNASPSWQMSFTDDIGVCYYFRSGISRQQVNFSRALQWCQGATQVSGLSGIRLARIITDQQLTLAIRTLTQAGSAYWNIWTEAGCNSTTGKFTWTTGQQVSQLMSLTCNDSVAVQLIAQLTASFDGSYKVISQLSAISTQSEGATLCEYDVPRCNMSVLTNYNSTRMQPDVEPTAGRLIKAACAPGYYRAAEVDGTADSKVRNRFDCQFVPDVSGAGSAQLVPRNNTVVDGCSVMACSGSVLLNLTLNVDFKDSYRNLIDAARDYQFGDFIPVECKTGYVKITNQTDVNSTINCRQNDLKPSEGLWDPIFCTPVPCNRSAMSSAFDPTTMETYKAYDRLKDHTYTDAETHLFPYFPNTVYVRCATNGQFFKDRKYDKTFLCNLLPNSTIEAGWSAVQGTLESSMQCQPITCLTNELVAPSYRSALMDYLITNGNFNDSVIVTDDTGLNTNRTMRDFASLSEYKYNVIVQFGCQNGFAMSALNESDGKLAFFTTMTSQCSATGSWNRIISQCIKQSAAIDATSGKKYVPEPKEAGSAQSLGAIVIVILVVFFSVIVILDMATLSRDIKLLKRNVQRLRLKAKMKRQ